MIFSQRAMMLSAARGLAKLVRTQDNVTWSNVKQVDEYISKMQDLAEKLARQNNELVYFHELVIKKVKSLNALQRFNTLKESKLTKPK